LLSYFSLYPFVCLLKDFSPTHFPNMKNFRRFFFWTRSTIKNYLQNLLFFYGEIWNQQYFIKIQSCIDCGSHLILINFCCFSNSTNQKWKIKILTEWIERILKGWKMRIGWVETYVFLVFLARCFFKSKVHHGRIHIHLLLEYIGDLPHKKKIVLGIFHDFLDKLLTLVQIGWKFYKI
jgi:hypothetical protein